jgi:hypothetical protein
VFARDDPAALASDRLLWGTWADGDRQGYGDPPWDMRPLDRFEAVAGRRVSIVHFGQPWYQGGRPYPFGAAQMEAIRQRGAIPLLDWGSWDLALGGRLEQPAFALRRIIGGDHDAYIAQWAACAREWGHPFFLRFDHEMNADWFTWAETANGNRKGEFIRAWRHVHGIFQRAGATNAIWVWSPVVTTFWDESVAGYYPGDAYVDWVAMDGYNWGVGTPKAYRWQSFRDVFGDTYRALASIAPDKPMMIAEVASTEHGGSKARWIEDAFASLGSEFPRIRALVWFDRHAEGMDWELESSRSAAAAFAAGIRSPAFAGDDFDGLTTRELRRMSELDPTVLHAPARAERDFAGPTAQPVSPWAVR